MPVLVGIYAPHAAPDVSSLWTRLTRGLGTPTSSLDNSILKSAIFPQHQGDRAVCPSVSGVSPEFTIGFGGDGQTDSLRLVPPWLACQWNPTTNSVIVSTDRYGFAPIYVRTVDHCVVFSTSAARLGQAAPCSAVDPMAVVEMVAFDHLLGERTWRREVNAVPQGCDLEIGPSGLSFPKRFRYGNIPLARTIRAADATTELISLWRAAMATALAIRGDVPVVVPLSGGLDSRVCAATAVEAGVPVELFTFGHAGHRPPDMMVAEQVARVLGAPWRYLEMPDDWLVDHAQEAAVATDGHIDVHHSYGVNVLDEFPPGRLRLDGLAGDVVLGGSFLRPDLLAARSLQQRVDGMWKYRCRLGRAEWRELFVPAVRDEFVGIARRNLEQSLTEDDDSRWSDAWIFRHRIRRFTLNGSLLWRKKMNSVYPFFAPQFFDLLYSLPPEARMNSGIQARFLWQGWPSMAAIAWQKTGWPVAKGGLVEKIIRQIKKPPMQNRASFYDFHGAFQRSERLQSYVRELLFESPELAQLGCFDIASIRRLMNDTVTGTRRGFPQLAVLASLVLAERVWCEGGKRAPTV